VTQYFTQNFVDHRIPKLPFDSTEGRFDVAPRLISPDRGVVTPSSIDTFFSHTGGVGTKGFFVIFGTIYVDRGKGTPPEPSNGFDFWDDHEPMALGTPNSCEPPSARPTILRRSVFAYWRCCCEPYFDSECANATNPGEQPPFYHDCYMR
jgi:hypothetical protein